MTRTTAWALAALLASGLAAQDAAPQSAAAKAAIAADLRAHIWPRLAAGEIRPVVYRTFPLAEAAAAHSLMESSEHIGKIMLQVVD